MMAAKAKKQTAPVPETTAVERLLATVVTGKGNEEKQAMAVIELKNDHAELFDHVAGADAIYKIMAASSAQSKARLMEVIKQYFVRLAIEAGTKIDNPVVVSGKAKAQLQVKHVGHLPHREREDGSPVPIEERLKAAGFEPSVVRDICSQVINTRQTLRVKALNEMSQSDNPALRATAEKIGKLIEREMKKVDPGLLVETTTETSIDDRWKRYSVELACRIGGGDFATSVDALYRLYEVIPLQFVLTGVTFGGELGEAFDRMVSLKTSKAPE